MMTTLMATQKSFKIHILSLPVQTDKLVKRAFRWKDLKSRKKSRTVTVGVTVFFVTLRIPLQKRLESRKVRRNT